jgi:hypothetical protein
LTEVLVRVLRLIVGGSRLLAVNTPSVRVIGFAQ